MDTSAWQALFDPREGGHPIARRLWLALTRQAAEILTSEYVFDELVSNVQRRAGHQRAVQAGTLLLRSPNIQVVDITRKHFDQAWERFQRYDDKEFSFTDVTSFLIIEEFRCDVVFAFDTDFERAGFRLYTADEA